MTTIEARWTLRVLFLAGLSAACRTNTELPERSAQTASGARLTTS